MDISKLAITSATLEQLQAFITQLEYYLENTSIAHIQPGGYTVSELEADKKKATDILSDFKSDIASHIHELEEE